MEENLHWSRKDEKILRMNRKASGITAAIDLKKEEEVQKRPDKQTAAPFFYIKKVFIQEENRIHDNV